MRVIARDQDLPLAHRGRGRIGEVQREIGRERRRRRRVRGGVRRRRRRGHRGRRRRLRGGPTTGGSRGRGLGPVHRGRRSVQPAPLRGREGTGVSVRVRRDMRLRGECTHDVAVSEVRRVGVVRHHRGGRIQPIGRSAGGVRLGDVRGVGHPWRDPSRVSRSAARALYSRLNDHEAPCVMSPSFSSPGLQRREGLPLRWAPEIAWKKTALISTPRDRLKKR